MQIWTPQIIRIDGIWVIKMSFHTDTIRDRIRTRIFAFCFQTCCLPFVIWIYTSGSSLLFLLHPFITQNYSGYFFLRSYSRHAVWASAWNAISIAWVSADSFTVQSINEQGNSKEVGMRVNASNLFFSPYFLFNPRLRTCSLIFREREKERQTSTSCLLYMPWLGSNPQRRYVPWQRIKLANFRCSVRHSNQLSHLAGTGPYFYKYCILPCMMHTFLPKLLREE